MNNKVVPLADSESLLTPNLLHPPTHTQTVQTSVLLFGWCILRSLLRGNPFNGEFLSHHHHQSVFHWAVRTSHQLLISGQDYNDNNFIIGHTGLSTSLNCSQPDPSTSEPSTRSCSVLLLSFSPPNLSHMVWNQTILLLQF